MSNLLFCVLDSVSAVEAQWPYPVVPIHNQVLHAYAVLYTHRMVRLKNFDVSCPCRTFLA